MIFRLEKLRLALPLAVVDRVVRAVKITPLPGAPGIVIGAVNVAGSVLPVLNIRQRLFGVSRPILPSHQFIIAQSAGRRVVLVMDEAAGVTNRRPSDIVDAPGIAQGLEHVRGVVKLEDGLAVIHDLDAFLSVDEATELDRALREEVGHGH
ncbi:MAG: chemotaxis protein CheW [Chthoniobacteraceae bacterium]